MFRATRRLRWCRTSKRRQEKETRQVIKSSRMLAGLPHYASRAVLGRRSRSNLASESTRRIVLKGKEEGRRAMNEKRERGTGRIFQRGSTWWIQYYVHGQQIRVSAETTNPKRAARFLRKRIGEVEAGIHKDTRRLTYEELREAYYQDYAVNQR